jgi:hypothetical protein
MAMAAGAICGFMPGFLLATAAIPIGVVLSFALSRSLFRPAIERLTARRRHLRNLDALIDQVAMKLGLAPSAVDRLALIQRRRTAPLRAIVENRRSRFLIMRLPEFCSRRGIRMAKKLLTASAQAHESRVK